MTKTRKSGRLVLAAVLLVATGGMTAAPAFAYSGQSLEKRARISMAEAEKRARAAVPGGRITDRELEREAGGSGLRYSFDIRAKGKTHEVGIDAMTGKLLENSLEGAHPD